MNIGSGILDSNFQNLHPILDDSPGGVLLLFSDSTNSGFQNGGLPWDSGNGTVEPGDFGYFGEHVCPDDNKDAFYFQKGDAQGKGREDNKDSGYRGILQVTRLVLAGQDPIIKAAQSLEEDEGD